MCTGCNLQLIQLITAFLMPMACHLFWAFLQPPPHCPHHFVAQQYSRTVWIYCKTLLYSISMISSVLILYQRTDLNYWSTLEQPCLTFFNVYMAYSTHTHTHHGVTTTVYWRWSTHFKGLFIFDEVFVWLTLHGPGGHDHDQDLV